MTASTSRRSPSREPQSTCCASACTPPRRTPPVDAHARGCGTFAATAARTRSGSSRANAASVFDGPTRTSRASGVASKSAVTRAAAAWRLRRAHSSARRSGVPVPALSFSAVVRGTGPRTLASASISPRRTSYTCAPSSVGTTTIAGTTSAPSFASFPRCGIPSTASSSSKGLAKKRGRQSPSPSQAKRASPARSVSKAWAVSPSTSPWIFSRVRESAGLPGAPGA